MGEFHHLTTKILITVLALETLAFAGCSADKPNKPSATSPALPCRRRRLPPRLGRRLSSERSNGN